MASVEPSLTIEEAPIFQGLSREETNSILARIQLKNFPPGTEILYAGQSSPGLYVIRSGLVAAIVRYADGSEREVGRLGSGECVGEMALLTGEPCSSSVRAISATEAWLLEPDAFLEITRRFPAIWRNFGRVLSQRLAHTSRHLAVRPFANTTVLIMDCPDEDAMAISCATASSVAHQTGQLTLLVDGRASQARPATLFAPLSTGPSFPALLKDQTLRAEHEAPAIDADGNAQARISLLHVRGEPEADTADALEVLEWLRRSYHHIIVLTETAPSEIRRELLQRGASLTVVLGGDSHRLPSWVVEASNSVGPEAKLKASILTEDLTDTSVIQSIENEIGQPVRRLPISGAAVRELGSGRPVPAGTDDERLRTGIDRLARQVAGIEVGLALGAGAAKGFAHSGVLAVLRENDIPIDFLVGTSIGAVVGALFAGGVPPAEIEDLLHGADRKLARWTLPLHSVWSASGLVQLLRTHGQLTRFRDLPIPFAAVATDLTSGREVVLRRGLVWKAVQASVTVPGMFPPAASGGHILVDGGLVNPVPGQTVRDLGADIVIAVDLMSPSARLGVQAASRGRNGNSLKLRIPNLVEILWRANEIMQEEVTLRSAATADLTIEPKLGRVRWSDFSKRGREYRTAGEDAARERMPEIQRLLGHPTSTAAGVT